MLRSPPELPIYWIIAAPSDRRSIRIAGSSPKAPPKPVPPDYRKTGKSNFLQDLLRFPYLPRRIAALIPLNRETFLFTPFDSARAFIRQNMFLTSKQTSSYQQAEWTFQYTASPQNSCHPDHEATSDRSQTAPLKYQ